MERSTRKGSKCPEKGANVPLHAPDLIWSKILQPIAAPVTASSFFIILYSLTSPSIRMLCHNGMHILEQRTIVRQPLAACCYL
jgi:hypothetical protein